MSALQVLEEKYSQERRGRQNSRGKPSKASHKKPRASVTRLSNEKPRKKERDGRHLTHNTGHGLKSLCGGGVPSSHPSIGLSVLFSFFLYTGHGEDWRAAHWHQHSGNQRIDSRGKHEVPSIYLHGKRVASHTDLAHAEFFYRCTLAHSTLETD